MIKVDVNKMLILCPQQYLSNLVELCQRCKDSPLHPERNRFLTKHILADFDPFFRRGLFEHTRHVASWWQLRMTLTAPSPLQKDILR